MLTVIAALLAWMAFQREPVQTAHAQSTAGTLYKAKTVPLGELNVRPRRMFEELLNEAVEGGEIVAVAPFGGPEHVAFMVVYKTRQRK